MAESGPPPDLHALAHDWVTLWQSELAAIAADREAQESWQAIVALWAGVAGAMVAAAPRPWPPMPVRTIPARRVPTRRVPARRVRPGGPSLTRPDPMPANLRRPTLRKSDRRLSKRTDAPAPLRRRGPRPLLLHLTLAMLRSTVSRGTSLTSNPARRPRARCSPRRRRRSPRRCGTRPRRRAAEAFPRALVAETLRQDAALIEGIAAYRRHPYSRDSGGPARRCRAEGLAMANCADTGRVAWPGWQRRAGAVCAQSG